MTHSDIIDQLSKNKSVFAALFSTVSDDLIRWRPQPDKWSLLEIVCHLYDEEREDFRARIRHLFDAPETAFKPIDPQGWVTSRNYSDQDFHERLNSFLTEREASIEWLQELKDPAWSNGYNHESFGRMTANMLLSNWLAHDYLHIRQVARYHFQYLDIESSEGLHYAGPW